jgi:hypothetical protein
MGFAYALLVISTQIVRFAACVNPLAKNECLPSQERFHHCAFAVGGAFSVAALEKVVCQVHAIEPASEPE